MSISYLIYTSKITLQASWQTMTFPEICHQSANHNAKANITGILCFKQGNFLQYMEGSEQAIKQLFDKITVDKRHTKIQVVKQGQSPHRLFAHWKMHCINLDKAADIDDISPVLDYFETPQFDSGSVTALLADVESYYRSGRWQHHQHTDFVKGSYGCAKMRDFSFNHRYFLWMQFGFLVFSILIIGYWYWNAHSVR